MVWSFLSTRRQEKTPRLSFDCPRRGYVEEPGTGKLVPATMPAAAAPGRARLYFVDYLRAALVCLVILHHTAITYGGSGSFYYTEPATDPVAALLLTLFTNFN